MPRPTAIFVMVLIFLASVLAEANIEKEIEGARKALLKAGQKDHCRMEKVCAPKKVERCQRKRTPVKVCRRWRRGKCDHYGYALRSERQCRTVVVGTICRKKRVCPRVVLLASWDVRSHKLTVVTLVNGNPSSPPGYTIKRETRTGVSSEFEVRTPVGQVVIGVLYPVSIRVSAKQIVQKRVFYVPASGDLRKAYPELVIAGQKYLAAIVDQALQDCRREGVKFPAIPVEVYYTLVLIEHFSAETIAADQVQEEMGQVYLTLGANGTDAYRYAVSSAEARGIAQVIPSTYRALRRRYPRLLPGDFYRSSAEHRYAMRAQVLLALEDLQYLFSQNGWKGDQKKQEQLLANPLLLGQYLAASYNGGPSRASRWVANQSSWLPGETSRYLVKFRQVWEKLR